MGDSEASDDRVTARGAAEREPDVLLDVPELSVDEIRLAVDGLDADLSLRARLANLLQLDAGVRVHLEGVELDITGVRAEALLKVRLEKLVQILDRALTTIDRNPELIDALARSVGVTVDDVHRVAGQVAGQVTEPVVDRTGRQAVEVGEAVDRAVPTVVGRVEHPAPTGTGPRGSSGAEPSTEAVRSPRPGDDPGSYGRSGPSSGSGDAAGSGGDVGPGDGPRAAGGAGPGSGGGVGPGDGPGAAGGAGSGVGGGAGSGSSPSPSSGGGVGSGAGPGVGGGPASGNSASDRDAGSGGGEGSGGDARSGGTVESSGAAQLAGQAGQTLRQAGRSVWEAIQSGMSQHRQQRPGR
ncbi:hypothetical protein [Micromonospora robiginosa]|uniref:Uncharacterized protein n=1 Tax=Micromonospora robiginosa TaxID=2749844 RepID=A0A7L6BA55_9ACTN|nr:hypothetical protein [Micromonospora ferruginea]QLQ38755.1 hypothetical protein H1D33_07955 [Micromonospora ferruginea]